MSNPCHICGRNQWKLNVSLETAKKLSKAGIGIPCKRWWVVPKAEYGEPFVSTSSKAMWESDVIYTAPNTDDLLAALPKEICDSFILTIIATIEGWGISYSDFEDHEKVYITNEILCEALAELLIWTKKEGYLK